MYQKDDFLHIECRNSENLTSLLFYTQCAYGDGNNYLGTELYRFRQPEINADVWRLNTVRLFRHRTGAFVPTEDTTFVNGGEWECAIREKGMPDFMGGNNHGDETLTEFALLIDEVPYDTARNFTARASRLEVFCNSVLNRVDTPGDFVAVHNKHYVITGGGIVLSQRIEWLQELTIERAFLTMFPVVRKTKGGIYVTNRGIRNDNYSFEDLSDGHDQIVSTQTTEAVAFNHGKGHQFSASVELLRPGNLDSRSFFFSPAPQYNKLYFSYCSGDYRTTVGEQWYPKTHFRYGYGGLEE